jgi:hypothetical protein
VDTRQYHLTTTAASLTPRIRVEGSPQCGCNCQNPNRQPGPGPLQLRDFNYNTNSVGVDTCRPILSNPTAPIGSVGINGGPGVGYLDFGTGASITPNAVHWLINNEYEALARGTPYPGVGRNILRGNTVNQLDASIFKTVRINERVSAQLRLNVFNLPNRAYYGAPDAARTPLIPRFALRLLEDSPPSTTSKRTPEP